MTAPRKTKRAAGHSSRSPTQPPPQPPAPHVDCTNQGFATLTDAMGNSSRVRVRAIGPDTLDSYASGISYVRGAGATGSTPSSQPSSHEDRISVAEKEIALLRDQLADANGRIVRLINVLEQRVGIAL